MGSGDKEVVDQAAVDAMRPVLGSVSMDGVVVIGEGEKDDAPMLYNGEESATAPARGRHRRRPDRRHHAHRHGQPNAITVVALADRGTMFDPGPCVYMEKLAVGPEAADAVDFEAPLALNLRLVAKAKGDHVGDLTVVHPGPAPPRGSDPPDPRGRGPDQADHRRRRGRRDHGRPGRHRRRHAGRHRRHPRGRDRRLRAQVPGRGHVRPAVAPQRRRAPGRPRRRLRPRPGPDIDDLVRGDNVFFAATGVTDGELLRGVRFDREGALTQSLSMRSKSGTVRQIDARHQFSKLSRYASIDFG